MNNDNTLQRFVDAQQTDYATALSEIESGRKRSHWMWYVFPQLQGLGLSSTAQYYGIKNLNEAQAYLAHPLLGSRLIEISKALSHLKSNDANSILGSPDDMKLRSCITLFAALPGADSVFGQLLDKFFDGVPDSKTLQLIQQ